MTAIDTNFPVRPIGYLESPLHDRATAPKQGHEGAPLAWLVFEAAFRDGLSDLQVGDDVLVLTWLDRSQRDVLRVHPRNNPAIDLCGVFTTRSPDRPNPIGVHRVAIADVLRMQVQDLEALDQTPILDLKPVLRDGKRVCKAGPISPSPVISPADGRAACNPPQELRSEIWLRCASVVETGRVRSGNRSCPLRGSAPG